LVLVHPTGHGDHHEPERDPGLSASVAQLSLTLMTFREPVLFHADPISGPYGAENVDIALDKKSQEIAALRARLEKLEGGAKPA
jgi:hypothetical protein